MDPTSEEATLSTSIIKSRSTSLPLIESSSEAVATLTRSGEVHTITNIIVTTATATAPATEPEVPSGMAQGTKIGIGVGAGIGGVVLLLLIALYIAKKFNGMLGRSKTGEDSVAEYDKAELGDTQVSSPVEVSIPENTEVARMSSYGGQMTGDQGDDQRLDDQVGPIEIGMDRREEMYMRKHLLSRDP